MENDGGRAAGQDLDAGLARLAQFCRITRRIAALVHYILFTSISLATFTFIVIQVAGSCTCIHFA